MLGYGYWLVQQNAPGFDVLDFIRRDWARPLFEPFGFCGEWARYASLQTAVLGLDFPVYAAATVLHGIISAQPSCVDALTTPRGHLITTSLALPVWLLIGFSIRRMVQQRWRHLATTSWLRCLLALAILPAAFCLFLLALSLIALAVSGTGDAIRLLGLGAWFTYAGALAAERLRVWPFHKLPG